MGTAPAETVPAPRAQSAAGKVVNPELGSLASPLAASVIQITLVGANRNPAMVGEDLQPGKVNYFIGNDPRKWHTNVPIYREIRYKEVYPGIDVLYYGNQSRVEHDFIIAPGADPNEIQLDIKGADSLSIVSNGDLLLTKGNDQVHLQAPKLFQEFQGMRVSVNGQYSIKDSTHISFEVGPYDKTMPLVIDPVLSYSTFLGGQGADQGLGIGVDSSGNTYVTGCTSSVNFPGTNGPPPSGNNAFLVKLNATGSSIVYADYIGGSSDDCASALALDSTNDVFLTGLTYSPDFPTVNPYQGYISTSGAAFVTEVSPNGASLVYSTYLSGSSYTEGNAIGVDSLDDIYVAGWTLATDFPTNNAYQPTPSPNQAGVYGQYGFVTKVAAGGASLAYSTYYAGNMTFGQCGGTCFSAPFNIVTSMAVDLNGNAYVSGDTNTFNFPITKPAYQATNASSSNYTVGFVGQFNSSGTLLYSTYYGATANNSGLYTTGITFDSVGSSYVVGTTNSDTNPIPITYPNLCDPSQNPCDNGFITKFDPTEAAVEYSTYLSSSIDAEPLSVAIDVNGNAYVYSQSSGGPPASLVNPIEDFSGDYNVFIQEIDPTGGTVLFSTFLGGSVGDFPGGITVDTTGNIYVSGYTDSPDFPVTSAAFQNTLAGSYNVFVSKIAPESAPAVALSPWSIQFPTTAVGSASLASTALLRNMGGAPLTISSVTTVGDFTETNTCGSGIAAAGNCTFTVTFSPTQLGPRSGLITIVDNAAGSPHVLSLAGDGAGIPAAGITPSSLTFASLPLYQTSAVETAKLTNTGSAVLAIGGITVTSEYTQTNNCPASLGVGLSCEFQIAFAPTASGAQPGSLTIADNAPNSPQTVTLSGTGADFSMPASGGSSTVADGATASYQFSISPVGGAFSSAIILTCSGLPAFASCKIIPQSVTPGKSSVSVTVAISTSSTGAYLIAPETSHHSFYATWTLTSGLALFGMFVTTKRKGQRRSFLLCALVAGILFWTSCALGGSHPPSGKSTPPGTYTVLVIGTSGSIQHQTSLSLTVQ
jgi:hypothetical protein